MAVPALTDREASQNSPCLPLIEPMPTVDESTPPPEVIRVRDQVFRPSVVFNTYWRFAAARQSIYLERLKRSWTHSSDDAILRNHRFTNVFRASDRVSQFLISTVQSGPSSSAKPSDVVFRTLLFKIFNRQQTWEHLERRVGPVRWSTYDFESYRSALDEAACGGPIYSAAYLMPPPRLGEDRKHANHLRLLEALMRDGLVEKLLGVQSLKSVFDGLVAYPGLGPFLAFQYAIDLNYSSLLAFDEDDFVVAGPGAKDGIRKCFGPGVAGYEPDIIQYMVDTQEDHFERLGLSFPGLFGRRLHLIDAQNLFCEVDKYARVRHPEVAGISGRSRIKQKFRAAGPMPPPVFPSRWGLDAQLADLGPDELDRSGIKVGPHSPAAVVPKATPRGVAGQDCPLPF